LLTDGGRSGNDRRWRHQYLDSKSRHCVNRSPEARKRLNNLRMASQPLADTGRWPGVPVDGSEVIPREARESYCSKSGRLSKSCPAGIRPYNRSCRFVFSFHARPYQ
jgi:hypothetical protein